MYFGDHNPPHFHVEFQGEKATFTFDGQIRSGMKDTGSDEYSTSIRKIAPLVASGVGPDAP